MITSLSCACRPASTDKLDRNALMIGVPSGSLSADGATKKHNFYFVIVDGAEPAVLEARSASTKALRLGPLLGAGRFPSLYLTCRHLTSRCISRARSTFLS